MGELVRRRSQELQFAAECGRTVAYQVAVDRMRAAAIHERLDQAEAIAQHIVRVGSALEPSQPLSEELAALLEGVKEAVAIGGRDLIYDYIKGVK